MRNLVSKRITNPPCVRSFIWRFSMFLCQIWLVFHLHGKFHLSVSSAEKNYFAAYFCANFYSYGRHGLFQNEGNTQIKVSTAVLSKETDLRLCLGGRLEERIKESWPQYNWK